MFASSCLCQCPTCGHKHLSEAASPSPENVCWECEETLDDDGFMCDNCWQRFCKDCMHIFSCYGIVNYCCGTCLKTQPLEPCTDCGMVSVWSDCSEDHGCERCEKVHCQNCVVRCMTCAKLICNDCRKDCVEHEYIGCIDCVCLNCKNVNDCSELDALLEHFQFEWRLDTANCEVDYIDENELSYTQRTTWEVRISFLETAKGRTTSLGWLYKTMNGWRDLVTAVENARDDLDLEDITKVARLKLDIDETRELLRLFVYCC